MTFTKKNQTTAAAKKAFRSLIIAGVILMALPSCKHGGPDCDAYRGSGSSRSYGKAKRHSTKVISRTNNLVSKIS